MARLAGLSDFVYQDDQLFQAFCSAKEKEERLTSKVKEESLEELPRFQLSHLIWCLGYNTIFRDKSLRALWLSSMDGSWIVIRCTQEMHKMWQAKDQKKELRRTKDQKQEHRPSSGMNECSLPSLMTHDLICTGFPYCLRKVGELQPCLCVEPDFANLVPSRMQFSTAPGSMAEAAEGGYQ